MTCQHLLLTVDDCQATVQLTRPSARNAISKGLMRELLQVAHDVAERIDVDLGLLTGNATCFTAGADRRQRAA